MYGYHCEICCTHRKTPWRLWNLRAEFQFWILLNEGRYAYFGRLVRVLSFKWDTLGFSCMDGSISDGYNLTWIPSFTSYTSSVVLVGKLDPKSGLATVFWKRTIASVQWGANSLHNWLQTTTLHARSWFILFCGGNKCTATV